MFSLCFVREKTKHTGIRSARKTMQRAGGRAIKTIKNIKKTKSSTLSHSGGTPAKHLATSAASPGFSSAAATRSLSASCRLTASSVECVPGAMETSTLNRGGSAAVSRVRRVRPIRVAMEQWATVGVKRTVAVDRDGDGDDDDGGGASTTVTAVGVTTPSCSRVSGCSGSAMWRMC